MKIQFHEFFLYYYKYPISRFFSTKGVAIIRPPGHHAEADEACGFCIFNNVPVAGMYLFCFVLKNIFQHY